MATASPPHETLGVYRGANAGKAVGQYEAWLGHPVSYALDYFESTSWEKIENPSWWLEGWRSSPYRDRMIYSVPIIPDAGGTLSAGAAGSYNTHFEKLARKLVGSGQGGAILRLGWEFN